MSDRLSANAGKVFQSTSDGVDASIVGTVTTPD